MENYIEQLTAKNSEYVHIITRELVKIGKTDEEIKVILSDILPQIVEVQAQRKLAKDILGTPSEFIAKYTPQTHNTTTTKSDKYDNEKPVLMWLDSALLMFGVITILNGVMSLFNKSTPASGIISLITMSFAAGFVIYLMYRLVYKPKNEGKKKVGFKSFALLTLAFLAWITLYSLSNVLPANLNPSPNSYVLTVVGLIVLGIRYLLKRKYRIKSALATSTPRIDV